MDEGIAVDIADLCSGQEYFPTHLHSQWLIHQCQKGSAGQLVMGQHEPVAPWGLGAMGAPPRLPRQSLAARAHPTNPDRSREAGAHGAEPAPAMGLRGPMAGQGCREQEISPAVASLGHGLMVPVG